MATWTAETEKAAVEEVAAEEVKGALAEAKATTGAEATSEVPPPGEARRANGRKRTSSGGFANA